MRDGLVNGKVLSRTRFIKQVINVNAFVYTCVPQLHFRFAMSEIYRGRG